MIAKTSEVFSKALRGIQFNSSQSTFKNESYAIMDEVVSVMSQFSDINVRIAGHTDSQGAEDNNQRLSCLLYTSPSPRDKRQSRMPSSA